MQKPLLSSNKTTFVWLSFRRSKIMGNPDRRENVNFTAHSNGITNFPHHRKRLYAKELIRN